MTSLDAIPFGKFCVTAADRAATAADRAATVRERTSFLLGPFPRRRLPVYPPGSCRLDRCHLKCRRGRRSLAENRPSRKQGQAGAHVRGHLLNLHTVHSDATCHFVTPGSKVERAMRLSRRHFPATGAALPLLAAPSWDGVAKPTRWARRPCASSCRSAQARRWNSPCPACATARSPR